MIVVIALLVATLLYFILPVSVPLIVAFVTALFLHPIVKWLRKKTKLNQQLAVLCVFLLFLLFIGASGYFVTTKVVTEIIKLVENAPLYINEITRAWLNIEKDFANAAKICLKKWLMRSVIKFKAFLIKQEMISSLMSISIQ